MAAQSKEQVMSTETILTTSTKKQDVSKLITSKEQILTYYPDVFELKGFLVLHTAFS